MAAAAPPLDPDIRGAAAEPGCRGGPSAPGSARRTPNRPASGTTASSRRGSVSPMNVSGQPSSAARTTGFGRRSIACSTLIPPATAFGPLRELWADCLVAPRDLPRQGTAIGPQRGSYRQRRKSPSASLTAVPAKAGSFDPDGQHRHSDAKSGRTTHDGLPAGDGHSILARSHRFRIASSRVTCEPPAQ